MSNDNMEKKYRALRFLTSAALHYDGVMPDGVKAEPNNIRDEEAKPETDGSLKLVAKVSHRSTTPGDPITKVAPEGILTLEKSLTGHYGLSVEIKHHNRGIPSMLGGATPYAVTEAFFTIRLNPQQMETIVGPKRLAVFAENSLETMREVAAAPTTARGN